MIYYHDGCGRSEDNMRVRHRDQLGQQLRNWAVRECECDGEGDGMVQNVSMHVHAKQRNGQ